MSRRRYAEKTTVPISQSRGEIDTLLRKWGCDGIQWTDEFALNQVTLRFSWNHEGQPYMARFAIAVPPIDEEDVLDLRTGEVSEAKRAKAEVRRGKVEHRILLLWLKAALNAVEAGIISAETLFLPFIEDQTGKTVAELLVPQFAKIPHVGLLGDGR
jgi:hypothetical protein